MSFIVAVFLIFLVLGLVLGGGAYLVYRQKLRKAKAIERGLKMVPILIHLPPPSEDTQGGSRDVKEVMREKTAQAEVLYNLLAGTATAGFRSTFYGQRHIALELIASEGVVHFYAAVPVALVSTVEKAIQTAYPGARMEMVEDHNIFNQEGRLAATLGGEMVLRTESAFPIATYAMLDRDPMEALLTSVSALEKHDGVAFQLMIRPATANWIAKSLRLVEMKRRGRNTNGLTPQDLLKATVKAPQQQRQEYREKLGSQSELTNLQQREIESIEEKTKHSGFEVLIRVIVSTGSVARSQQLLRDIATTFALYDMPGLNGFTFLPAVDVQGLVTAFIFRFFPPELKGNVLNSVELATLFHLPDAQFVPSSAVERLKSKQVDGPVRLPAVGLLFGFNQFRGIRKEIRLSDEDRRRHTYILGQTGTGKSTMLENLAVQDMLAGKGFAFIDPHGDSAEKLLALVPKNRAEDIIYFNPGDTDNPLGLNLFEFSDPTQKDFLVQETINMLYKLYDPGKTGIIGPRYEHWYRNAALTLMSDPNGATFIEIPKVFTDTEYLKKKFRYLKDPTVIDFWTKEMGQTSDYHKSEMLGWFVSKFGAFQNNEMMRNIIGQTKSSFNIRAVMDQKKILIVNLSKGRVGELNSQLLGMMFVIKFQAAAMSRADVPEDQRPDFALYVDEFQNFSTDSFASILSEARKYRLNLIVANQFVGQLKPEIRDAVFGNIGTIVAHRMGPEDAEFMVKQFAPVFDASDLMNIPNYNAAMRLMIGGLPSQPFTILDNPPLGKPNLELGLAVKQLSAAKYGHDKHVVEAEIMARMTGVEPQAAAPLPEPSVTPQPVTAPPVEVAAVVPTVASAPVSLVAPPVVSQMAPATVAQVVPVSVPAPAPAPAPALAPQAVPVAMPQVAPPAMTTIQPVAMPMPGVAPVPIPAGAAQVAARPATPAVMPATSPAVIPATAPVVMPATAPVAASSPALNPMDLAMSVQVDPAPVSMYSQNTDPAADLQFDEIGQQSLTALERAQARVLRSDLGTMPNKLSGAVAPILSGSPNPGTTSSLLPGEVTVPPPIGTPPVAIPEPVGPTAQIQPEVDIAAEQAADVPIALEPAAAESAAAPAPSQDMLSIQDITGGQVSARQTAAEAVPLVEVGSELAAVPAMAAQAVPLTEAEAAGMMAQPAPAEGTVKPQVVGVADDPLNAVPLLEEPLAASQAAENVAPLAAAPLPVEQLPVESLPAAPSPVEPLSAAPTSVQPASMPVQSAPLTPELPVVHAADSANMVALSSISESPVSEPSVDESADLSPDELAFLKSLGDETAPEAIVAPIVPVPVAGPVAAPATGLEPAALPIVAPAVAPAAVPEPVATPVAVPVVVPAAVPEPVAEPEPVVAAAAKPVESAADKDRAASDESYVHFVDPAAAAIMAQSTIPQRVEPATIEIPSPGVQPTTEPAPRTAPRTEPRIETPDAAVKAVTPDLELSPLPTPEIKSEPKLDPEPKPDPEPGPEPEPKPKPEPESESKLDLGKQIEPAPKVADLPMAAQMPTVAEPVKSLREQFVPIRPRRSDLIGQVKPLEPVVVPLEKPITEVVSDEPEVELKFAPIPRAATPVLPPMPVMPVAAQPKPIVTPTPVVVSMPAPAGSPADTVIASVPAAPALPLAPLTPSVPAAESNLAAEVKPVLPLELPVVPASATVEVLPSTAIEMPPQSQPVVAPTVAPQLAVPHQAMPHLTTPHPATPHPAPVSTKPVVPRPSVPEPSPPAPKVKQPAELSSKPVSAIKPAPVPVVAEVPRQTRVNAPVITHINSPAPSPKAQVQQVQQEIDQVLQSSLIKLDGRERLDESVKPVAAAVVEPEVGRIDAVAPAALATPPDVTRHASKPLTLQPIHADLERSAISDTEIAKALESIKVTETAQKPAPKVLAAPVIAAVAVAPAGVVKHGGDFLTSQVTYSPDDGLPEAESLAVDDVARERAEREAEKKLSHAVSTQLAPVSVPVPTSASVSSTAKGPSAKISRHRQHRRDQDRQGVEVIHSAAEAAHNRPTEAMTKAASLTGRLIMPSGERPLTTAEPVAQAKPKQLAPGEVYVDAKGNVMVGE